MRTLSMSLLLCAASLIVACGGSSPMSPASSTSTTPITTSTPVSTAGGGTASVKGPFSLTGSMTTARANQTATLLPNGKVLITGGDGVGSQALASAELYDPSTGTFTPTGSMTTARTWGHTATLLANGRVLIAGGTDSLKTYAPLTSAELYDPSTGMFTLTGSMPTAQRTDGAALLQDGRVFVVGDSNAAIYDPSSGTFAQTGAYIDATPVSWVTVNLLADGRVLLTGCAAQCTVGATELFDPKSGTFSTTGPMTGYTWDNENTATLLTDGRVLFVGNDENDGSLADAEIYDPAAATFTSIGKALAPHEFAAAVRLADGTVLITGGQLVGGNGNAGSDLYLPATGIFGSAAMTTGRHSHTATLLSDGTVLIVGGYSTWPTPTASAEIYDPSCSGCWDY
jgi:hypothetical protein